MFPTNDEVVREEEANRPKGRRSVPLIPVSNVFFACADPGREEGCLGDDVGENKLQTYRFIPLPQVQHSLSACGIRRPRVFERRADDYEPAYGQPLHVPIGANAPRCVPIGRETDSRAVQVVVGSVLGEEGRSDGSDSAGEDLLGEQSSR